jgi:hypothetical protein
LKFDSITDKDGKKRKKVAIVGFAESSRHLAPFDNDEWEIWAMNQLYRHIPRATRWWEMHKYPDYLTIDQVPGTDYAKWLAECPIPVYMTEQRADVPNSVRFPIEHMVQKYGDYYYSSISYMLAQAIEEGLEEIGLWGIDLAHDSEYEYQKPSAEYFLGVAIGQGITVRIPEQSALLKGMYRYGYQEMPTNADLQWLKVYKSRVQERQQELVGVVNQLAGQIACAEEFEGWLRSKRRGSAPPDPNQPNPDKVAVNT